MVCALIIIIVEGSTESLGSTAGSFRNTLLETTDLDYKRVSVFKGPLIVHCGFFFVATSKARAHF